MGKKARQARRALRSQPVPAGSSVRPAASSPADLVGLPLSPGALARLTLPDPLEVLAAVVDLRGELDAVQARCVARARAAGASWADVAGALGVTPQAVHKRYG